MDLISKAKTKHILTKDEIIYLLESDKFDNQIKIASANTREKYSGNIVHLKGLLEFSNVCAKNCFYCGLRKSNKNIDRYKLNIDEILNFAKHAVSIGYKTIVLQSGESKTYKLEEMIKIIEEVKKLNVSLTLSVGEKSKEEYEAYKKAGADRFLLRIETTDTKLYNSLHTHMSHQNRMNCLKILKSLGYETGSGGMVGLPNQTIESIANDILFFQESDFDMIGIGPFIPSENTPLQNAKKTNLNFAIKVMAIVRLLMPNINIPATTAMETLSPNGRLEALSSGANVVMPVITEGIYQKLYRLYPGKACTQNSVLENRNLITNKVLSIGQEISQTHGNSERFNEKIKQNNIF